MSELLSCHDLTKKYGSKVALDNFNISLEKGKIIGLLGPNGSGKTTLIKLIAGLLCPSQGQVLINGSKPGIESKKIISYLPDKMYYSDWMRVKDLFQFFEDFYEDFDSGKAATMCDLLDIKMSDKIKKLSKGNKEKLQLILVMSRQAQLYLLDEPIAGVDPAARDYILETILNNYNQEGTIIISTHLISDIEKILDEVIMINGGQLLLHKSVDDLREENGLSIDRYFREQFRAEVVQGGDNNVG